MSAAYKKDLAAIMESYEMDSADEAIGQLTEELIALHLRHLAMAAPAVSEPAKPRSKAGKAAAAAGGAVSPEKPYTTFTRDIAAAIKNPTLHKDLYFKINIVKPGDKAKELLATPAGADISGRNGQVISFTEALAMARTLAGTGGNMTVTSLVWAMVGGVPLATLEQIGLTAEDS